MAQRKVALDGSNATVGKVNVLDTNGNGILSAIVLSGDANVPPQAAPYPGQTVNYPLGFNGTSWDRVRVSNGVAQINSNGALASAATMALWTPGTGKRFRVLKAFVSASVAGHYSLMDGGLAIVDLFLAANTTAVIDLPTNGILSAAANNVLGVKNGTAGAAAVYATAVGTEE